eukprot:2635331-Rhodomonas_salina.2
MHHRLVPTCPLSTSPNCTALSPQYRPPRTALLLKSTAFTPSACAAAKTVPAKHKRKRRRRKKEEKEERKKKKKSKDLAGDEADPVPARKKGVKRRGKEEEKEEKKRKKEEEDRPGRGPGVKPWPSCWATVSALTSLWRSSARRQHTPPFRSAEATCDSKEEEEKGGG